METTGLLEEHLTGSIIGAFFEVYNTLGFGFLERLYVLALERELKARGHFVERESRIRIVYKGELLGIQRLDLVVDNKVVIEVKANYELHKADRRQLFNYLRASNLEVGLLLHFGPSAKFYRLIHRNDERSAPIRVHPENPYPSRS
jgi:GxxExxY protein